MVFDQLIGTWHPHRWHQGPEGVVHVHLGALWEHLQGYMWYQKIRCDSQMQNLLLVGTLNTHHLDQGQKSVIYVLLGALGENLQG